MTQPAGADDPPPLAGEYLVTGRNRARRRTRGREREALSHIPAEAYQQPILRRRSLRGPVMWLNDPAAIKHVLVDNVANYPKNEIQLRFFTAVFGAGLLSIEGETWRSHRRIMAPSFDPRSVAAYAPAMAGACAEFLDAWRARPAGEVVDVAEAMTNLTLSIISRTMFSSDGDTLAPITHAAVGKAQASLNFNLLDLLPVIGPIRAAKRAETMRAIFADLDRALEALIAAREGSFDGAPRDLLTRLIAAKDAESGARLTAQEVRDEVVTIFLAGHETTAAAMSWVWYLLSQHPAAEAKLHAELDRVLGGRPPSADDIGQLSYTRMVIEEAMRLYPPAPGVSPRQALAADEICGQPVRPGAIVFISFWVLHHNPKIWDRPLRFEPERFAPEPSAARPRFAYLPFGAGPRVCIGQTLAVTEAVLILATLAQHVRLSLAPDETVEIQQYITLRPKGGLRMVLEHRGPGGGGGLLAGGLVARHSTPL
jgi:cytochrome P450